MNKASITPITKDSVFSRVPKSTAITYSTFDQKHRHLTAINENYLYPIFVKEVYPGDILDLNEGRHLCRMNTPILPFMDELDISVQYFYTPNRIIWEHWKEFLGENKYAGDDDYVPPTYQVPFLNSGNTGVAVSSIFDYAGIPTLVPNLEFSALPFRAMNYIYNEWYRDENLSKWLPVGGSNDVNGVFDRESQFGDTDQLENYSLFKRSKKHDQFTSALPSQQNGPAVMMSLGQSASVVGNGMTLGLTNGQRNGGLTGGQLGSANHLWNLQGAYGSNTSTNVPASDFVGGSLGVTTDPANSGLIADLTTATGLSINDFRLLMQIQAIKEREMRMGKRYKELIYGTFNVVVSDATLDRPEYLVGYNIPFSVIPVASTVGNEQDPQGNLSSYAYAIGGRRGFKKGIEEHGWVIGFLSIRSTQSYMQGLNRMWSRKNKFDFYDPLLANISEQGVKMKEILAQGANVLQADGVTPVDEKIFGYQEAWYEMRYQPNMITGLMRTQHANSLKGWHLAQVLTPYIDPETGENMGVPLNQEFIEENIPISDVVAVQDEMHFTLDNWFDLKATRELPIYSVPSFLLGRL